MIISMSEMTQWNLYEADTKPGPEINVLYFPLYQTSIKQMWTLKYIVNSNLAIVNNLFDSVRLGLSSSTK